MGDKITVPHILKMKQRGEKITCLTAYDYSFARILDEAGVEMLLVGDSLGCVVQGGANTLAVTMDEMIYHTRLVARGRKRALVIGDMPFMSYQTGKDEALRNAGRFLKEAGAEAVKLEGGVAVRDSIRRHRRCRHSGDGPYRADAPVGAPVRRLQDPRPGKANGATALLRDAVAVEEAGAFAVVLEGMPSTWPTRSPSA